MKYSIYMYLVLTVVACGRGRLGSNGIAGRDGADGKDGTSCFVEVQDTSSYIYCEDGSESVIQNGTDGADGTDGTNGVDGISLFLWFLDDCTDLSSNENGIILVTDLGLFTFTEDENGQSGKKLSNGFHKLSNKHACIFTIENNGPITLEP